jgi:hypothetical protein
MKNTDTHAHQNNMKGTYQNDIEQEYYCIVVDYKDIAFQVI